MITASHRVKPGHRPSVTARRTVGWPEIIRALAFDRERKVGWHVETSTVTTYVPALERFRRAGFGPDDFARSRDARRAMTTFLTRTEDDLELQSNPLDRGDEGRRLKRHLLLQEERLRIRDVRRRLELEVAS